MASLYPEDSAEGIPISASSRGLATYLSAVAASVGNYLHSEFFEPKVILERPLKISEAYCLLWQREDSGDVDGRLWMLELLCGACGAVMLDLAALKKIEVEEVKTTAIGRLLIWDRSPVKVLNIYFVSVENYLLFITASIIELSLGVREEAKGPIT